MQKIIITILALSLILIAVNVPIPPQRAEMPPESHEIDLCTLDSIKCDTGQSEGLKKKFIGQ